MIQSVFELNKFWIMFTTLLILCWLSTFQSWQTESKMIWKSIDVIAIATLFLFRLSLLYFEINETTDTKTNDFFKIASSVVLLFLFTRVLCLLVSVLFKKNDIMTKQRVDVFVALFLSLFSLL